MFGWSVIHSGWIASMDGKATTLIGDLIPSAMTVTEETNMGMCSQGTTTERSALKGEMVCSGYTPWQKMEGCYNLIELNMTTLSKTLLAVSVTGLLAPGIITFGQFNLNQYIYV
ncbi:MAG TPA: hypothetical protein VNX46_03100 [Candidatus Acidoferrum sp.]|nr:hypothetical protein [Candidatus Acidoferrum sp.]